MYNNVYSVFLTIRLTFQKYPWEDTVIGYNIAPKICFIALYNTCHIVITVSDKSRWLQYSCLLQVLHSILKPFCSEMALDIWLVYPDVLLSSTVISLVISCILQHRVLSVLCKDLSNQLIILVTYISLLHFGLYSQTWSPYWNPYYCYFKCHISFSSCHQWF